MGELQVKPEVLKLSKSPIVSPKNQKEVGYSEEHAAFLKFLARGQSGQK